MNRRLFLLASAVIDRSLNVIPEGFVEILGGRTVRSGARAGLSIPADAEVVDLGRAILMPGLVNAHCHLDYTLMKGEIPADGGFAAWIARIVARKKTWSDADYKTSIELGMRQCVESGTTLIANITCVPHLVSSLDLENAPRVWWFAEQIDLGRTANPPEGSWEEMLRPRFDRQGFSLSPHALHSVTPKRFRESVAFCNAHNLPWTTHVAESREEWEMFHDASGALFELTKKLGRDMSDCGEATPFQILRQLSSGASTPALLAHMNTLSDEDLALLSRNPKCFSVAHCPRSHAFFSHPAFRMNELRDSDVPVCLGTDSLASNKDLSMFSEMRKMKKSFPQLSAGEVIQMATLSGAKALGHGADWADWADWIALPDPGGPPASSVIQFADSPFFVMVSGKIVKKTI